MGEFQLFNPLSACDNQRVSCRKKGPCSLIIPAHLAFEQIEMRVPLRDGYPSMHARAFLSEPLPSLSLVVSVQSF